MIITTLFEGLFSIYSIGAFQCLLAFTLILLTLHLTTFSLKDPPSPSRVFYLEPFRDNEPSFFFLFARH